MAVKTLVEVAVVVVAAALGCRSRAGEAGVPARAVAGRSEIMDAMKAWCVWTGELLKLFPLLCRYHWRERVSKRASEQAAALCDNF